MILHFCTASVWADAQRAGEYTADTLATEGFIHCSSAAQVHIPATIRARGRTDLVLLEIDESRLPEPPRWEPGDGTDTENLFPHVYGPIPVPAVVAVHPYPPEPDGSFAPPKGLV